MQRAINCRQKLSPSVRMVSLLRGDIIDKTGGRKKAATMLAHLSEIESALTAGQDLARKHNSDITDLELELTTLRELLIESERMRTTLTASKVVRLDLVNCLRRRR